jgi:hypothetical protein
MGKHKKPFKPSSKEFEVGYGRPPKDSRFKAGKPSGNPSGKRKGTKNRDTLLVEFMQEPVTITENGKPRKFTRAEALTRVMYNLAIKGNLKALTALQKDLAAAQLESERRAPGRRTITDGMTPQEASDAWARLIARKD